MRIERFIEWMKVATIVEKRELAKRAETSLSLLYQLSYGTRKASSELAGRIERAAAAIARKPRHSPLPVLRRGDLSSACAKCDYYQECQK